MIGLVAICGGVSVYITTGLTVRVWTSCNMWGVSVYITTGLTLRVWTSCNMWHVCLSMLLLD